MQKNKLPQFANLAELYRHSAQEFASEKSFLSRQKDGSFSGPTYAALYADGLALAAALRQECQLKPREHVGFLADNRLEWIICDYAVILCGAADVPRGTDATVFDIEYILNHAECRIAIVENQSTWNKLASVADKLKLLEHVILIDNVKTGKTQWQTHSLSDLLKIGRSIAHDEISLGIEKINPRDFFTIIYTSGTTGAPKGVMLTHGNVMSQIRNLPLGFTKNDVMLSILPIWHIFERAFEIVSIACGAKTAYTNVKNLKADLQTVRPTFMGSAPRLWESIYNGVMTRVTEGSALNRRLFNAAVTISHSYRNAVRELQGKNLRIFPKNILLRMVAWLGALVTIIFTFVPALLLDTLVLSKIRQATGGRLRATISGGGALPLHIDEFFNDIGIAVLEGYGLTETSPIISVRIPENAVIGTVGPLYKETEIRIIDLATGSLIYPGEDYFGKKGELHMRGPQLMAGYYKNPEATARVVKDGWFNTGDLVIMTANDCLKIVGRSKETVVLMNGENVEPVPIESKILESKFVEQCMVVGQDQKSLGVLIIPRVEALREFGANLAEVAASEGAKKIIRTDIARLVSAENGFKSFERIGGIAVLDQLWEKDRELTAKLSLRRHVITDMYAKHIKKIYED